VDDHTAICLILRVSVKRVVQLIRKIIVWSVVSLIGLALLTILLLQFPSVQSKLVRYATVYLSSQTGTQLSVGRVAIRFPRSVVVQNIFATDLNKDTLVYIEELSAGINMLSLLDAKLQVSLLHLKGVNAHISRSAADSAFNFSFFNKLFSKKSAPKSTAPKDTTSAFVFDVNEVWLQNIRGSYVDEVSGLSIKGNIGDLNIHPKTINLQKLDFFVHSLSLSETSVSIDISKLKSAPNTDTTISILPGVGANRLTLHNVKFYLNKPTDSLYFFSEVGDLDIIPATIDLNKQLVTVTRFNLHQSQTGLSRIPGATKPKTKTTQTASTQHWQVNIVQSNVSGTSFRYDVAGVPRTPSGIDYNHLLISGITLDASKLFYSPERISGDVKKLQASEQCGLQLKQLGARFVYDDHHAELANLNLRTQHSVLNKYMRVSWTSLSRATRYPEELDIHFQFNNSQVSMKDVLLLAPQLKSHPELTGRSIALNGTLTGKLQKLELNKFSVQTGQTIVEATGYVNNILTPKQLSFKLPKLIAAGTRADVEALIPKKIIPSTISLPERFLLTGSASGSGQTANADVNLKSSDGELDIKGSVDISKELYNIHTVSKDFNAGRILGIQQWLGPISGTINLEGEQFELQKLKSSISCELKQAEIYKHAYSNISLNAKAETGIYSISMQVNDTALKMNLEANANSSSQQTSGDLSANIAHADLLLMNLSTEKISGQGNIKGAINPSTLEQLSASLSIKQIKVRKNNRNYTCDSLLRVSINEPKNRSADKSVVTIDYKGSTQIQHVSNMLRNYLNQYTNQNAMLPDSLSESLTAKVHIQPHPILSEVFFPTINQFNGAELSVLYNHELNTLHTEASMPLLEINHTLIKGFSLEAKGSSDTFWCETSILSFQKGAIAVPKTSLQLFAAKNNLGFELQMIHPDSGTRIWVKGAANKLKDDELSVSLTHPYIILNNQKWMVDELNKVLIKPDDISVENLTLSYKESSMQIASQNQTKHSPLDIQFKSFEVGTFSELIEKDTAIARGLMNGFVVVQTYPTFGFTSDLSITQMQFNSVAVGNLSIQAKNTSNNQYSAHAVLSGLENDVVADLDYESNNLKLDINVRRLNLSSIEAFVPKVIRKSNGFVHGHIDLTQISSNLTYKGKLSFSEASFNLAFINNRLYMEDEGIRFDQTGIFMNDFTIRDSMQQPMVVNGSIRTPTSAPMEYNLKVKTQRFRILNTTAKDNPIYYGTLVLNSNIQIEGTNELPIITAQAKLIEGSHLTFVVQQGQLSTDKGDGIVVFTDSSNTTLVPDSTQMLSSLRGLNLRVNAEVNNKTKFNIITDKTSGDNLQVSGDAMMSFTMDPNGRMSLVGAYELNEGNYKASFQKIVKRDFQIKKGSTIVWSGDPLDAQIDITATYKVKTGATDLLAAELSGMPQSERNAYRKLLTYDVNLMMHGFLLKPQLNFKLDMAPKDQQVFNGMVYAKINQINNDVNELNKQVFSVLIMGRFLPVGMASNTSTSEAVSAVARNSVNQLLSDQMNTISGKYVKGAELNFNLQSNDDYTTQGTEQNTELQIGLKKELFNNRASVQVGSNIGIDGNKTQTNGQNITGDIVMEYKITEDGRYRFKAFRENNYEGVIDGLIYRTGIGINFTRNFDSIQQIFRAPQVTDETLPADSMQSE